MWLTDVRVNIATGRSDLVERRYLPLAGLCGMMLGVVLSFAVPFLIILVILAFGFLLGYAVRSYVSHRRRMEYYLRRMEDTR